MVDFHKRHFEDFFVVATLEGSIVRKWCPFIVIVILVCFAL